MQPGVSYKFRSHVDRTKVAQDNLSDALKIHHVRYGGGGPRENLELAMSRWIRSKRSGTALDKLIELWIALEALYEIGGLNEKGFRIATYGAWHIGRNLKERRECRETLRKVYDDSSRAVHAGKLKHAERNPELVSSAQDICRKGILKRLEETERPKWDEIILGSVRLRRTITKVQTSSHRRWTASAVTGELDRPVFVAFARLVGGEDVIRKHRAGRPVEFEPDIESLCERFRVLPGGHNHIGSGG